MLSLSYIYATFKSLPTVASRIQYLQQLQQLNLPYSINYANLIACYKQAQD
jgi:hypothetical protein